MKLAIADPPYLGRSVRWYGGGRGSGRGVGVADNHPAAAEWDDPLRHRDLVTQMRDGYEGWAIACSPDYMHLYLDDPSDLRVMVWHRRNAPPSGSRVMESWEAVVIRIPPSRRARATGLHVHDVLDEGSPRVGFTGAKPEAWTRWVLQCLGAQPDDEVVDLFAGSGMVSRALAQGRLL